MQVVLDFEIPRFLSANADILHPCTTNIDLKPGAVTDNTTNDKIRRARTGPKDETQTGSIDTRSGLINKTVVPRRKWAIASVMTILTEQHVFQTLRIPWRVQHKAFCVPATSFKHCSACAFRGIRTTAATLTRLACHVGITCISLKLPQCVRANDSLQTLAVFHGILVVTVVNIGTATFVVC